jgi:hypothetical protein
MQVAIVDSLFLFALLLVISIPLPTPSFAEVIAVKTEGFNIDASDCGTRLILKGQSFYTVTLGDTKDFPEGCLISLTNGDPLPNEGGRGKQLSISGYHLPNGFLQLDPIIYPQQTFTLTKVGSEWIAIFRPPPWVLQEKLTLYVDCEHGNDQNDGLGPGSSNALGTLQGAWAISAADFYENGGVGQITVRSTGICAELHIAGIMPGQNGRAGFVFDGQGSTTISPQLGDTPCIALYEHAVVEFIGLVCKNEQGGGGISVNDGALGVFIDRPSAFCVNNGNITKGAAALAASGAGSEIEFYTSVIIGCDNKFSTAVCAICVINNAVVNLDGQTIVWTGNTTYTAGTVYATTGGLVYFGNVEGQKAVSGRNFNCSNGGQIFGTGGKIDYIPGNVIGTKSGCAVYR